MDEASKRIFIFHERGEKVVDFSPLPSGKTTPPETRLDLAVLGDVLYILDTAAARIYGFEMKISQR